MKPEKIEFTPEEGQALLNLLDKTVKAVGLSDGGTTSNDATYFLKKIQTAFTPQTPKEERDKVLKKVKK